MAGGDLGKRQLVNFVKKMHTHKAVELTKDTVL